jgi:site-specific DNA recombinase
METQFMTSVPQTKPRRAALYLRVSSQQQEDNFSLPTQEERCRQYASERGYQVADAHVFREVYTGVELWERPHLSRLREMIRRHEIDVVIAYAIDRLSRDPVHLGVILSEADHAGVRVEFVTEPLDDSPEGQLIRFVRGYAAKVEHTKIKERMMRGMATGSLMRRRRSSSFTSQRPPSSAASSPSLQQGRRSARSRTT